MIVVPQVLRMLLDGIEREVLRAGRERQWRALNRVAARAPWPMRRWLFRGVHRQLGGHLSLAICGGATLPPDLAEAWERMGVKVVEGYGATECAPIVSANTPQRRVHGTLGRPAPGVDVRLSAEGEIQVRGDNVHARLLAGRRGHPAGLHPGRVVPHGRPCRPRSRRRAAAAWPPERLIVLPAG